MLTTRRIKLMLALLGELVFDFNINSTVTTKDIQIIIYQNFYKIESIFSL